MRCPGCGEQAADAAPLRCPRCDELLRLPPAVQGLEAALAWLLVALGLLGVGLKLRAPDASPPTAAGAVDSVAQLEALWSSGRGKAIALACLALLLGAGLTWLLRGKRMLAALARALREPVAAGPVAVGHLLLAYGVVTLTTLSVLLLAGHRPAALELTAGGQALVREAQASEVQQARWDIPPDGLRFAARPGEGAVGVAGVESERAVLSWSGGLGTLRVRANAPHAPAVRVEGRPVADGASAELRPGSRLSVGAAEFTVAATSWSTFLLVNAASQAVSLAVLLGLLYALGGAPLLRRLGVTRAGLGREALRGAACWLAFLPLYLLTLLASQAIAGWLGLPVESHALVKLLERDGAALLGALVFVQAALLAPPSEEVLFRGLGLSTLARAFGPRWGRLLALLATALLFGVVHEGFAALLPMIGLGLLFGALRWTSPSGSLVAPVVAHALHNGLTLLLVFAIQGGSP